MKYKAIIAITLSILASGCSDASKATKVLSDNGYTNISTGGYAWFMCGEHDVYSTEFYATSPSGKRVSGAVCSGLFKGNTIRFD